MLATLDRMLWQNSGAGGAAVAIRNSAETTLALRGLGGVGKTMLAQQYAWDNRDRYHGVWWIRAETRETIVEDLAALGRRLIPNLDAREPEDAALAILDRIAQMRTEKPWLLVYDNADDQDAVRRLTPPDNAHVLITTRLTEWYGEAEELPLDVFERDTAIDFLLAEIGRESRESAGRLADALDRLPLALSHARAYCGQRRWPFERYIEKLPELIRRAPRGAPYPVSVFATFSLAIDRAVEECPEAERLMGLMAFFAPDQIPLWLVSETALPEDARDDAIAALNAVSLVRLEDLSDGAPGVAVHRLVQEVMRARLIENGNSKTTAAEATLLVYEAFDQSGSFEAGARNTDLLPHALALLSHAPREGADAWYTQWVLLTMGRFRLSRGESGAALAAYEEGRDLAQRLFEADPKNAFGLRDLSMSQELIGEVLGAKGQWDDALAAHRASLDIRRKLAATYPSNAEWHRELSVSHSNVGDILVAQGKGDEALAAYNASLKIAKRLVASYPNDTLFLHHLGIANERIGDVLLSRNNLVNALTHYEFKHEISSRLVAGDSLNAFWQHDLSVSFRKLGDVLLAQGKKEESLTAYRAGLRFMEKLTAADPSNTEWQRDLSVCHELIGMVLVAQGKGEDALAAYRASLNVREALAAADPSNAGWQRDLSVSHNKIGDVLVAQGKGDDALAAYRASLKIAEALSAADPSNAGWQRDLAWSHWRLAQHGAQPRRNWQAVVTILRKLDADGRLSPADKKWLPVAESNLAAATK